MILPHRMRAWEQWAPVVARVLLGAQFVFAASGKVPLTHGFVFSAGYAASHGVPFAPAAIVLAFLLEFVAGVALLIGWHARLAAFVLAPYILALAVIFYHNFSDPISFGFFISHISLIAALLYVSVYGAKHAAVAKD